MSVLQPWLPAQADPQVPVNENFEALEHVAVYGRDATSTAGLTWGYLGGRWSEFPVAAGTVALTASAINYLVVNRNTGVLSASSSSVNWNNTGTYARVYRLDVGAVTVSLVEDWRCGTAGVLSVAESSTSLASLSDVSISSPADGQALVFSEALGKWVPGTGGGGGGGGGGAAVVPPVHHTPVLKKTGAQALSVVAGSAIYEHAFAVDTEVTPPATWVAGEDYSVWIGEDGSLTAVVDPITAPAVAPTPGARKFAGFHYGLVAPATTVAGGSFATSGVGMIWTQTDVDKIAGINAFSFWDLSYRPRCDPRGMCCVGQRFWLDIYYCGTQHITQGTSRYNSDVASGTVLPVIPLMFGGSGSSKYSTFTWHEAAEVAMSHGKRLLSYQEFSAAAFGVTELQSIGGAEATIPATARQAGYTSKWGGEQMTGHLWSWGNTAHAAGGSGWSAGVNRGYTLGVPYAVLFGGTRADGSMSGSRCANFNHNAWHTFWTVGLRAACDFL